jgi:hypothetical protein
MLSKQIIFSGKDKYGHVLCQPILGEASPYLEKTASVSFKPSNLHPAIQRLIKDGSISKTDKGIYVLVSALGAAEYWGSNVNGDSFPEASLINSPSDWINKPIEKMKEIGKDWPYGYPTFMNAYPFKHHANKDPSRAFGHVVLAVWNPQMFRVELVVYLDKAKCKEFGAEDVYQRIENGEYPDVSMGCKVPYDRCSICGHKSKTTKDYCDHAKYEMNKIYPDGRKVCVINDYPRFFDISFVFIGADKSAKMLAKLAQVNNMLCMGDYCAVPRLSADIGEKFASDLSPQYELQEFFKEAEQKTSMVRAEAWLASVPVGAAIGALVAPKDHRGKGALIGAAVGPVITEGALKLRHHLRKIANDPIKEKIEVAGVPVWLEWKSGETREYRGKGGKIAFSKLMKHHYGYIPNTMDADGEELDAYVGPSRSSNTAWVIKQLKKDGSFDENKVMMGFTSKEDAKSSYDHHMGGAKERFGGIKEVPVSALKALFGNNGDKEKQAHSCSCDCGGTCMPEIDKLAEGFGQKSASHAKLSEITKIIPAGPFRTTMLPKLEKTEGELPKETLKEMAKEGMSSAISTSASLGIVLKPEEFQYIVLTKIGEDKLANFLHNSSSVFEHTTKIDDTFGGYDQRDVSEKLATTLLKFTPGRSIAGPVLEKRASIALRIGGANHVSYPAKGELLEKIAELYNGYRQGLVKKANLIDRSMVFNPHLSSTLGGESLVMAFAGGKVKTSYASVLGPESLAYLIGAHYDNREFHLEALAQSGILAAA